MWDRKQQVHWAGRRHAPPSHHPSPSTQPHYPNLGYPAGYSQNVTPHPTSDLTQSSFPLSPAPHNQSPLGSEGPSIDPECPAVPDKHGFEGLDRAQCRCSWVSGSGRGSFFSVALLPSCSLFSGCFPAEIFWVYFEIFFLPFSHFVFYSWVHAPLVFSFS